MRPVTVADKLEEVAVNPPGLDVTLYAVTAEPPLEAGASHETTTWPLPATPVTVVGAPGTVRGVIGEEAEADELPAAVLALTENV